VLKQVGKGHEFGEDCGEETCGNGEGRGDKRWPAASDYQHNLIGPAPAACLPGGSANLATPAVSPWPSPPLHTVEETILGITLADERSSLISKWCNFIAVQGDAKHRITRQ
jgi:hypothetical protein